VFLGSLTGAVRSLSGSRAEGTRVPGGCEGEQADLAPDYQVSSISSSLPSSSISNSNLRFT
jgi:hypothetical protein